MTSHQLAVGIRVLWFQDFSEGHAFHICFSNDLVTCISVVGGSFIAEAFPSRSLPNAMNEPSFPRPCPNIKARSGIRFFCDFKDRDESAVISVATAAMQKRVQQRIDTSCRTH